MTCTCSPNLISAVCCLKWLTVCSIYQGAVEQGWRVPLESSASVLWQIRCLTQSPVYPRPSCQKRCPAGRSKDTLLLRGRTSVPNNKGRNGKICNLFWLIPQGLETKGKLRKEAHWVILGNTNADTGTLHIPGEGMQREEQRPGQVWYLPPTPIPELITSPMCILRWLACWLGKLTRLCARRLGEVEREIIRYWEIIPGRCRWAQIDGGECIGIYYTTASTFLKETHVSLRTFWGWILGRYCESGSYLTRVLIWGLSDHLGRECTPQVQRLPKPSWEAGCSRGWEVWLPKCEQSTNTRSWCGILRSAGPI